MGDISLTVAYLFVVIEEDNQYGYQEPVLLEWLSRGHNSELSVTRSLAQAGA